MIASPFQPQVRIQGTLGLSLIPISRLILTSPFPVRFDEKQEPSWDGGFTHGVSSPMYLLSRTSILADVHDATVINTPADFTEFNFAAIGDVFALFDEVTDLDSFAALNVGAIDDVFAALNVGAVDGYDRYHC
jgi:hypothetical protein